MTNKKPATAQLNAFITQVQNLIVAGHILDSDGLALIENAEAIIDSL